MRAKTMVILGGCLAPIGAGATVTTTNCYTDTVVAAGPPLDFVSSLAVRPSDGRIFVADDDGQAEIYRLEDTGPRKVVDATTPGFSAGATSSLSAIVFGPDGALHAALADGRVFRFGVLGDEPSGSAAELLFWFPSGWLTDIAFDGPSTLYGADFATGSGDPLFRASGSGDGWQVEAEPVAHADGISGLLVDGGTVYFTEWATGTLFQLDVAGLTPVASAGGALNFQLALDGKVVRHPSDPAAWLITVGRDASLREAREGGASTLASGYTDSVTWPGTNTFPSDIVRGSGSEVFVADGIGVHRLDFTCGNTPADDPPSGPSWNLEVEVADAAFPSDPEEAPAAGCAIAGVGQPDRDASAWVSVSIILLASLFPRRLTA